MQHKKEVTILTIVIIVLSVFATVVGIFSEDGPGVYEHTSIRGQKVLIYGKGIYKDMSAEVAPQGIAQDVVTLTVGVPLLIISLIAAAKGSLRAKFLLTGTLGYFLVTYLFYTVMGMFNQLFMVNVLLLSASFYAFIFMVSSFKIKELPALFHPKLPLNFSGGFLIFSSIAIASLWLQIVLPSTWGVMPPSIEHYTTLIVQGLDLALLLPAAFIAGILLIKKRPTGFLLAPVYTIFLSVLMTALTAKVVAIAMAGVNVFPAVIIIPFFNLTAIVSTVLILKKIPS